MNIALARLIEGIIATMRSDVIPNVSDPYARGQAIGVIDLLNNIAPRIEWTRAPLAALVQAKADLLREIAILVPTAERDLPDSVEAVTADELLALKARLDAAIGDALALAWPRRSEENCGRAIALIKSHLNDEAAAEMKRTRKPLFAEIASGDDGKARN